MEFFTIWLRGGGGEKSGGPTNFLSSPFKIQSLQIGVKSRKNIWTKLPPPLINVSDFFFFFFILFLCNIGLLFLFLFFFFFFWLFLCNVGFLVLFSYFFFSLVLSCGGFFFISFFFFYLIFFFLRKYFRMISYAIFWNVHFHLYTIFF